MNDTLRNKAACAIEPETFKQPHINLFLESYQKAWAKADAVIPVVLDEACAAIQEKRLSKDATDLNYFNGSIYLKGLIDGYEQSEEEVVRNLFTTEYSEPIEESEPSVDFWKDIAKSYAKSNEQYKKLLKRSEQTLKPFAGCIYNDNGDIIVDYSVISNQYDVYVDAYFLHRKIEKTLKESNNG